MMKFKLTVSNRRIQKNQIDLYKSLGFVIENGYIELYDEDTYQEHEIFIDIDTLEELSVLSNKFQENLIINFEEMEIEIYNGYRE